MDRRKSESSSEASRSASRSRSLSRSRSRTRSRTRSRSRSYPTEHAETRSNSSREREHTRSSYRESRSSLRERERHTRRSRSRSGRSENDALKQHWKPIRANSRDFEAWVRLLAYVERLDETKAARQAYDEFLKRYPYCYGYWRKYAEFERRHKHVDRCIEVYERGIAAVPLSVDLWLHYISYVSEAYKSLPDATGRVREVFTRAIGDCGLEFRSDKLWEEFIDWEMAIGETKRAGAIFDQLLSIPTFRYSYHFERYQKFVRSHEPDQVVSDEEYEEVFKMAQDYLKNLVDGELFLIEEVSGSVHGLNSVVEIDDKNEPIVTMRRKHCEEALRTMRNQIIERKRRKYVANEAEVARRWNFEESIRRPYFHVKPLEMSQIKNWHAYLDMEIANGDSKRILVLFERCLIACALYEEMWLKYVDYLESVGDETRIRNAYKRAAEVHLTRSADVHLAYCAFEEKRGDFAKAREILADFDRRCPGYAKINIRRVGIERRCVLKVAEASGSAPDYSAVISRFERLVYDSATSRKLSSNYSLRLARFHYKARQDRNLAVKIVKDAIHHDPSNAKLYSALVEFAYSAPEYNEKAVVEAFDCAIKCDRLSNQERLQFSSRKSTFLEEFGASIDDIQANAKVCSNLKKIVDEEREAKKKQEKAEKKPRINTSTYGYVQQPQPFYSGTPGHPVEVPPQNLYGLQQPQHVLYPPNTYYYGNQVPVMQPMHQQRIF